jgi:hypothetical protein
MNEAQGTSEEFQAYAWFSVQVDQYYSAIRIFARNHNALRTAYLRLPKGDDWPKEISCLSQTAKDIFITASSVLNYVGTTGIFQEAPYKDLNNLNTDIINFGFYTCFTFQWTLFENIVKNSIMQLSSANLLSGEITSELKKLELRTYRFLKYIDDGHVFGHSPFRAILPKPGRSLRNVSKGGKLAFLVFRWRKLMQAQGRVIQEDTQGV